jgi:glutamate dehydrogenase/leucine dehydrogenase
MTLKNAAAALAHGGGKSVLVRQAMSYRRFSGL